MLYLDITKPRADSPLRALCGGAPEGLARATGVPTGRTETPMIPYVARVVGITTGLVLLLGGLGMLARCHYDQDDAQVAPAPTRSR